MPEWVPIWVMPNLRMSEAIEARQAALVPFEDPRIAQLASEYPSFQKFINRFTDAFGAPQTPTILLARKRARISGEAMASFRDLVVLSVVPYNRAEWIVYGTASRKVLFSNFFWLYPWMMTKDFNYLYTASPVSLGMNDVDHFNGQATPEAFPMSLNSESIDRPLLEALIYQWHRRYFQPNPTWEGRALFRSLNMANIACQLPSIVDTTLFDFGRTLALWVSAFEILVHPGKGKKSNQAAVNAILNKITYVERAMHRRLHRAYDPKLQKVTRAALAQAIYGQLYKARNDFLHGNAVSLRSLRLKNGGAHLTDVAPSLYRLALTEVLALRFTEPPPPASDFQAYYDFHGRRSDFNNWQHMHERALMKSRKAGAKKRS